MNARVGHRSRALERLGAIVIHRAPNHTLSWLLGQPVERLTVARRLPEAPGSPADGTFAAAAAPGARTTAHDTFAAAPGPGSPAHPSPAA